MRVALRRKLSLAAALVGFISVVSAVAMPRLWGGSPERYCSTRPTHRPEPVPRLGYSVDAALEELTQTVAPALRDRWAGGWVNSDGTITVGLTGSDPLPQEAKPLTDHPKVRIITQRHSVERLSAAHQVVVSRLNELLAPTIEPGAGHPWPYLSGTEIKSNRVEVTVQEQYRDRCAEIESVLADELQAGTVHVTYGPVPVVKPD